MSILSFLFPTRCALCGMPGAALCNACAGGILRASPSALFSVYDYAHPIVRRAVRELKYRRRSELARALIDAALPYIYAYLSSIPLPYILVPIPQHPRRARERGFNQSELIARLIDAERTEPVLRKVRETRPQAGMTRNGRAGNLVGSMEAAALLDPGVSYVIVDDVHTTGATFSEARRALLSAGAVRVYGVAVAGTKKKDA